MKLEIRKITELGQEWDQFVNSSMQNSVLTSSEFLNVYAGDDPSWQLLTLGCYDAAGCLLGAQVIIHRKWMGKRIQSSPNVPYNATPILSGHLDGTPEQYDVLFALARATTTKASTKRPPRS